MSKTGLKDCSCVNLHNFFDSLNKEVNQCEFKTRNFILDNINCAGENPSTGLHLCYHILRVSNVMPTCTVTDLASIACHKLDLDNFNPLLSESSKKR